MTTERLQSFVVNNDFGYSEITGVFCAVCDNQAKEQIVEILARCNTPEKVEGENLDALLEFHPEFKGELDNGCTIYACEEYDGANRVNTHFIAYYE